MREKKKTIQELRSEIAALKRRIAGLEEIGISRRRVEEELRISGEKYRILFESFPLGISITDDRGNILESNEEVIRLFRRLKRGHLRQTIFDPDLMVIRPDGSEKPLEEYPSVRALREKRLIAGEEIGIASKGGEVVWLSVTAAPIPLEGYGVVIAYSDITERKRTERELLRSRKTLEKTFASLRDALFIIDATTLEIIDCNPAATQIFGYSMEEMLGRTTNFLHVDEPSVREFRERLTAAMAERGFLFLPRFRMKRKNGGIFPTEHCVRAIEEQQGKRLYWVSAVRDISDQIENEEKLEAQKEQLRALALKLESLREEERGNLAREIHDQFGQSFTALKMEISFLKKRLGKDDQVLREKAQSMIDMIDRNIEIVRNLSTQLRPGILDDLGLIAAIEWLAGDFESHTGIRCVIQSGLEDIDLESNVKTASFRILQEALTNVARHARASEVKITLKEVKGVLDMEIQDNGRGIVKSEIANANSLGILGMKERVGLLGGSFSIRGTPGRGTSICVRIPLNREAVPVS